MWSLAGVRLVDCREGGIAPIVPGYNAALRLPGIGRRGWANDSSWKKGRDREVMQPSMVIVAL